MWANGLLTAESYYWTEGQLEWEPITTLISDLEPPNRITIQNEANIQSVELQSQMKSPAVAALLAIFIPLFGAGYGSPTAMGVSVLGAMGIAVCFSALFESSGGDPMPAIIFSVSLIYIHSIFWAVGGASSYNKSLIEDAKQSVSRSKK